MHMGRVIRADVCCLKPQMIITVGQLCPATRMNQVDLRRHLIVWPQPCLRCCCDGRIGKIVQEHLWRCFAQLLQGIPNAVI